MPFLHPELSLFSPDVATAWLFGEPDDRLCRRWAAPLASSAVRKRHRQFAAGRLCASECVKRLGAGESVVGIGESGEPLWPAGVVGSISHTDGIAIAAAGRATAYLGIGVDVEAHAPLPAEAEELVLSPRERKWVRAREADGVPWSRLVFSAKEAAFKVWFPLERTPLDFSDIELELCPGSSSFTASVLKPGGRDRLHGKFCVIPDFVFTAVAVPQPSWRQWEQRPKTGSAIA